jgi:hypothetical protein|tara:strand:+ start:96 stop:287 length:192 start_codon:yes stop_codon:yes gene_type:complete
MSHPFQDRFYEDVEDILNQVSKDCDDKSPLTEQNDPEIIIEELEKYLKRTLKKVTEIKNRYRL